MGGGDLNLKKSWHPHTMKNMERVWKAEQKDTEEKKRIAELQKEINAERDKEDMQKFAENSGVVKKKDDIKLEWMYKGPSQSVNHEEYLLGKAIDKTFEKYNNEQRGARPEDEDHVPGAVREAKSSVFSEQVDMARKIHEDPLMAIRQRAVEKAKQLYNNPVKLKQIQKMAAEMKGNKKEKKKSKKSKKEDKKELDALITARLKSALKDRQILRKLKKKAKKSDSNSSCSSSSSSDSENCEGENDDNPSKPVRDDTNSKHAGREMGSKTNLKNSHLPEDLKDRKGQRTASYEHRGHKRWSRSPQQHSKAHSYDYQRRSRSRSRDRHYSRKEYSTKHDDKSFSRSQNRDINQEAGSSRNRHSVSDRRNRYHGRSNSPSDDHRKRGEEKRRSKVEESSSRNRHNSSERRNKYKSQSPSSSDSERKTNIGDRRKKQDDASSVRRPSPSKRKVKRDRSSSSSESDEVENVERRKNKRDYPQSFDSDDDKKSKKKMTYGLMMADGSKPVVKQRPIQEKVVKPIPQQKPVPWQKKERVKLTEEEKEKRRQEMLNNATWRDKEREANVKQYRMEEDREKKQLHENFDDDFARKQFSKAAEQSSVEGRIKSKLNTIQRSRMAMDQNFARR